MKKLPKFLKQYFWDVDFEDLNLEKSKTFILKRILELGEMKAVRWLLRHYSGEDIKNLILSSDDLSPKTANFWADYLGIDSKQVPSLKKPHPRRKQIPLTSEYLTRVISWPWYLPSE